MRFKCLKYLAYIILVSLFSANVFATTMVQPRGEHASINTGKTIEIIKALQSKEPGAQDNATKEILKSPNDYAPPALFLFAHILFQKGEKEAAMFWFYTAQLRARSDANKSQDQSTQAVVTHLSQQFGSQINQFAFTHIAILKKVMTKVILWDKQQKRNYDPRWIALFGVNSYASDIVAFRPSKQWEKIDELTRVKYYNGFKGILKSLKDSTKRSHL